LRMTKKAASPAVAFKVPGLSQIAGTVAVSPSSATVTGTVPPVAMFRPVAGVWMLTVGGRMKFRFHLLLR